MWVYAVQVGCVLFALQAGAKEYTIKQVADKTMLNREPVISGTGLIAWFAYEQNQDRQKADIYVYKDGVTSKVTKDRDAAGIRPYAWNDTLVWEGRVGQETTIQQKAPAVAEGTVSGTGRVTRAAVASGLSTGLPPAVVTTRQVVWGICSWRADDGAEAPLTAVDASLSASNSAPQAGDKIRLLSGRDDRRGAGPLDNTSPVCYGDTVAWQQARDWPCGWEIVYEKNGAMVQLTTNCYYDMGPQLYGDQLVWYGWDGQDFEIMLYDISDGQLTQLTDNVYDDMSPVIWDGLVAWEGYPSVESDIFIWQDGVTKKISNNIEDDIHPRVWNGMVVWQGVLDDNYEIFLYDGSSVKRMTDNEYDDIDPDLRDNMLCWVAYEDNWDAEVVLQGLEDEGPTVLTDNDYEDSHPRTAVGRVVWEAKRIGLPLIYVAEPQ